VRSSEKKRKRPNHHYTVTTVTAAVATGYKLDLSAYICGCLSLSLSLTPHHIIPLPITLASVSPPPLVVFIHIQWVIVTYYAANASPKSHACTKGPLCWTSDGGGVYVVHLYIYVCVYTAGGIYIHSIIIIIIIITIIRYKDTHTINNRFILCAAADEELNHPKNAVLDPAADLYRFFSLFLSTPCVI